MEKYCTHCGRDIIRVPRRADKIYVTKNIYGDERELGTKFNENTGMRQFGIVEICPKYKWWKWWHDYRVDRNSLHDSDLPELLNL